MGISFVTTGRMETLQYGGVDDLARWGPLAISEKEKTSGRERGRGVGRSNRRRVTPGEVAVRHVVR